MHHLDKDHDGANVASRLAAGENGDGIVVDVRPKTAASDDSKAGRLNEEMLELIKDRDEPIEGIDAKPQINQTEIENADPEIRNDVYDRPCSRSTVERATSMTDLLTAQRVVDDAVLEVAEPIEAAMASTIEDIEDTPADVKTKEWLLKATRTDVVLG